LLDVRLSRAKEAAEFCREEGKAIERRNATTSPRYGGDDSVGVCGHDSMNRDAIEEKAMSKRRRDSGAASWHIFVVQPHGLQQARRV
jgi:hypothetical protein